MTHSTPLAKHKTSKASLPFGDYTRDRRSSEDHHQVYAELELRSHRCQSGYSKSRTEIVYRWYLQTRLWR